MGKEETKKGNVSYNAWKFLDSILMILIWLDAICIILGAVCSVIQWDFKYLVIPALAIIPLYILCSAFDCFLAPKDE